MESIVLSADVDGDGSQGSLAAALIIAPEDTTTSLVGVRSDANTSSSTRILASPNPSSGRTSVNFELAQATDVVAGVFDIGGRLVRVLHDGRMIAGSHHLDWDGRDTRGRECRDGVYFVRVRQIGVEQYARAVLLR